jgi:hypothetical protein
MYNETDDKTVLCCANSYEQKYYFNEEFNRLPEDVKQELQIMCVLFTEEVGGIISLAYDADGSLSFDVMSDEGDLLFDEIGCGLMIKKLQTEKRELLEALEMFYKVFVLGEDYD